jgi:ComF family protein
MRQSSSFVRILYSVLELLFPSFCPVCGKPSDNPSTFPVCSSCWESIERLDGRGCRVCGAVTQYDPGSRCQECKTVRPVFDRVIAYGVYDGALKEIIHLIKFGQLKRPAKLLGDELATLEIPSVDCIIPVPLSCRGLRTREFNQAALIAKRVSEKTGIPLCIDLLKKVRETVPQSTLSVNERRENVKNAYEVSGDLGGMKIVLVDDVVTTCATVNECARVLKKAGAASVMVLAAARATNR